VNAALALNDSISWVSSLTVRLKPLLCISKGRRSVFKKPAR
jgi:hypothetical protein